MDDLLVILTSFAVAGALVGLIWLGRFLIIRLQKRWELNTWISQLTTCPHCDGSGFTDYPRLCGLCFGKGLVSADYSIELDDNTVVTAEEFNSIMHLRQRYENRYEEVS